ncbi:MAG: DUF362 domain-containing protein [Candidatus Omnitrophica bacterium]|nr:DUF362 domain-containing protein [Candidatus Omnitrophota bacterium]MDD5437314.1 DUF362 domain-containing protein [Candidatus Omnitrophota bacterium]
MGYASKVYFIKVAESDPADAVSARLAELVDKSRVLDAVGPGDKTAVKMHFGEEGNTGHVRAEYAGIVCRKITARGAEPFLADTNTLYRGRRTTSADHIKLAAEHGFTKKACGAGVIVPDDTKKGSVTDVEIDGEFFKTAKVASIFLKADSIVSLAHFKGHIMTAFGGGLKNIGMGCASREGKLAQHSEIAPIVYLERCEGCMACVKSCPADAIRSEGGRIVIDPAKCIGCATCIAECVRGAIEVDWEAGGMKIQEKMVEYASAVLLKKKKHLAFINFATKITKECDCLAKDDPRIIPDIGIFASNDPVSVDKACYDACINASGKDIFKTVHPDRDGSKQLKYAAKLGLGDLDYELIEL